MQKHTHNSLIALLIFSCWFALSVSAAPVTFTLQWQDNATNEEGFKIYAKTPADAALVVVDTIQQPNVETYQYNADVTGGEVFEFAVSAYNTWMGTEQESALSNTATATIAPDPGQPAAPAGATVVTITIVVSGL